MKNLTSALILLIHFCGPLAAYANPYLAKAGETSITVRIATCAITGGFIHLYAALDNGLADKYGMKVEFVSIRGSGVALAALAADEISFSIAPPTRPSPAWPPAAMPSSSPRRSSDSLGFYSRVKTSNGPKS